MNSNSTDTAIWLGSHTTNYSITIYTCILSQVYKLHYYTIRLVIYKLTLNLEFSDKEHGKEDDNGGNEGMYIITQKSLLVYSLPHVGTALRA